MGPTQPFFTEIFLAELGFKPGYCMGPTQPFFTEIFLAELGFKPGFPMLKKPVPYPLIRNLMLMT